MKHSLVIFLLIGFSFFACENEKRSAIEAEANERSVEQRVRPAAKGGTSAAYFSYINGLSEPDTLLGVNSDISALTQVHESYETENGMMGMRKVPNISVQAGDTVYFEQGGLHIMFIQLKETLSAGDSVSVMMNLAKAGEVEVRLQVKN